MSWIFFWMIQLVLIGFVWKLFLVLLFKLLPGRIVVSVKERRRVPRIRDKKIIALLKEGAFQFVGYRYETIFKIFRLKYFLFKNKQNIYLDITSNNKFYYISYFRDGRGYFYFSPSFQVRQYEDQYIKVAITQDFSGVLLAGEERSRIDLSKIFYKEASSLFSIFFLGTILLFVTLYFAQLIYLLSILLAQK